MSDADAPPGAHGLEYSASAKTVHECTAHPESLRRIADATELFAALVQGVWL